jgi:hypothetical protein
MTTKQTPALNLIRDLKNSAYTSYWLTNALQSAELRDPVDVLRDAKTIIYIFSLRLDEMRNESRESVTS